MMNLNGKNAYTFGVALVAVIVALLIGGGIWWYAENGTLGGSDSIVVTNQKGNAGNLSYGDLVKAYGNRRIQFDEACELVPNNVTFKNGTTIMLDNRAAKAMPISLDSVRYNIGAEDYVITTLSSPTLPHTVSIDCGKGKNNGQIFLQK